MVFIFSCLPICGSAILIADPINGVRNELVVVIKRTDFFPFKVEIALKNGFVITAMNPANIA